MIEKIKNIFNNKEKKVENLISFLIILIITLIIINKILKNDNNKVNYENTTEVVLANTNINDTNDIKSDDLEKRLENILGKISGVGKVAVLVTYSESKTIVPVYNVNLNQSKTEEEDSSGTKKTSETTNEEKEIVKDSNSNLITEKIIMPHVEGAIITAQGASNPTIRGNIISAVEAVTGIATHKIQVYEMGDD